MTAAKVTEQPSVRPGLGAGDTVKDELPENETPAELDLVFCIDCTGSMQEYISKAQQSVKEIVSQIKSEENCDVRFALIAYRDHPPQDHTFVTQTFPFTIDLQTMKSSVSSLQADGGGDGPEAVTAALYAVSKLPYRPNAAKVVVLIADAPPHGLEPYGDEIPNGDPDGHDPLEIARQLAVNGVVVYPVGCEPALGAYRFARDFMCNLAEITQGQAIPLSSADLLPQVILGGAQEEIALEKLSREVEQEMEREEYIGLEDEELVTKMTSFMQKKGHRTKQLRRDGKWEMSKKGCEVYSKHSTLSAAKEELCRDVREENNEMRYAHETGCSKDLALDFMEDHEIRSKHEKRTSWFSGLTSRVTSRVTRCFSGTERGDAYCRDFAPAAVAFDPPAAFESKRCEFETEVSTDRDSFCPETKACTYAYVEEDSISEMQIERIIAKSHMKSSLRG